MNISTSNEKNEILPKIIFLNIWKIFWNSAEILSKSEKKSWKNFTSEKTPRSRDICLQISESVQVSRAEKGCNKHSQLKFDIRVQEVEKSNFNHQETRSLIKINSKYDHNY